MNILGVHYGHNATVCLMQNGRLVFCQSEERLNRIKNCITFPSSTLEYIYQNLVSPEEIDHAILFESKEGTYCILKKGGFKPMDGGHYLNPDSLRHKWKEPIYQTALGGAFKRMKDEFRNKAHGYHCKMMAWASRELRLPPDKVHCVDHHLAHAHSAVPNIQGWGQTLIFTLDASGDGLCATVNMFENGEMRVLSSTSDKHSLGDYYTKTTCLLGMKGSEHEFKVMGMAPYAKSQYYQNTLEALRRMIRINEDGDWESSHTSKPLLRELDRIYRFQRFDNVAGAIQELTEELTCQWVLHWIRKTGCRNIALAGGVFMNVKACQRIAAMDSVKKIFIVPSAGDETTAVGAAVWAHLKYSRPQPLEPIRDLYLGVEFKDSEIEAALKKMAVSARYDVSQSGNINLTVAKLLAENKIVARCSGRMEFGARALGNRSILANPSDFTNLNTINEAIKCRDFWMPFTPSILEEEMPRYIQNHDRIFAPYMCITFDSTPEARRDLKAALHPKDLTVRPQCVIKAWNPDYHELISEFKKLTGIGGVLNTSFNLHGEPNVCSPVDAIHTLDNSGLNYLAMGSYLLSKRIAS
jgi:carbamoyltransferase